MKMKTRIITLVAAFSLLPFASAFSADGDSGGGTISGDIGGTGWVSSVTGNKAKFSEYRDMTSGGGFYSNIRLGYDSDTNWMKFRTSDMGYDTQNYQLDGGSYGNVKFNMFYNEIIHNITFDAKTPYSSAGGNVLTYTGAAPSHNPATWNSFDYSIKRKQTGGDIKFDMLKPFYIDFSATNERRTGILPVAANTGMTSPGAFIELPAPIAYTTNNFMGEIGYAAKPVIASLSVLYSNFTNDNHVLNYESILSTKTDTTTLPPDNDYYRIGFKGSLQLPLNTRFNVNLANAHSESTFDLLRSYLLNGTTPVSLTTSPNSLSSSTFHGKKDIQNYNFVLTSNPVSFLDGKIFYKYYNTTNKSDQITAIDTNNSTTASAPGFLFTNPLFDYKKNTYGGDLGFRLPARFYLDIGYSYVSTDRSREDIPVTNDNIYKAELRWNGLDYLTPKIGYERLQRNAAGPTAADLTDNFGIDTWLHRFDASRQTRDTYKAAVDFYPLDKLDMGVAYKYKKSDYPGDILGLQNSRTDELDIYGEYGIGNIAKVNGYFDIQNTKTNSSFRRFDTTNTDVNPSDPQSASLYNWNMAMKDDTYEFGAGVDVYLVPKKLTLRLQYDYVNSDGNDDLSIFNSAALAALNPTANNSNIDIPSFDDYKKSSFTSKLSYAVTKSIAIAAGFSYEQYRYSDASLNNYKDFFTNSAGTTAYYLSGAYANPSYTARIFFLSAAYKF
ncbi:MAG: MtrB/PioB family outer membrane beta-barrel protein [Nitrospirae bacterium]|nr:MtrB/PioB family outer membrane beta-barrel protein [Nitrospirota bacterium]